MPPAAWGYCSTEEQQSPRRFDELWKGKKKRAARKGGPVCVCQLERIRLELERRSDLQYAGTAAIRNTSQGAANVPE